MTREHSLIMPILLSLTLATPTLAETSILSDDYSIMVPEKGSKAPKRKIVSPPTSTGPGYVYVPQTGRTFQNLPTVDRGIEASQDRAIRCSHQAGVYGQVGANRGTYMGSCF